MSGGGGGGGKTNTVVQPWSGSIPYLREGLLAARGAFDNPPEYFHGQTYVGPTSTERSAWQEQRDYTNAVFGNASPLRYDDVTDSATRALRGGFGQAGTVGGLDARRAITSALSGRPDYRGLEEMAAAANAPIMRDFYQQYLPSLNSRATFLNNETGAIKDLNRVLPELGSRMSENALDLYNSERMRALSSRDSAAGLVANMGGQWNQQALTAMGMAPSITQLGTVPGDLSQQYARYLRGFDESALNEQMSRWDFAQNQPRENAAWYMSQITPAAGLGQSSYSQTKAGSGSTLAGALGGGMAGYGLASGLGGYLGVMNPALGLGITGVGALLGSGIF